MLNVSNLSKIQGGDLLFSKGTFQINPGEKVGLVGPNGVGKTTLFRLIIGEERPNEGQVSYSDKLRLSYFSQNVGEMKGKTALQEVIEGDAKISEMKEKLKEYEDVLGDPNLDEDKMNDILIKMGDLQTDFERVGKG